MKNIERLYSKFRNKTRISTLTTPVNRVLKTSAKTISKEKNKSDMSRKGRSQTTLFIDDISFT